MDEVLLRVEDRVAEITLNRPEAMNALNRALCLRLREVIREVEERDDIWVAIIRGAGDRAFCAGIDLRERKGMSDAEVEYLRRHIIFPLFRELEMMEKPLVGAINGAALGGGAEIALICDVRVASETATFGQREVAWGIIPAAGACQRLPRLVGMGRAKELLLLGKVIDAREAERIGLFNAVVPPERLEEEAWRWARQIAENAPIAVRLVKKAINLGSGVREAMEFDLQASELCYHTEDRLEGVAAFNERRKPRFKGR